MAEFIVKIDQAGDTANTAITGLGGTVSKRYRELTEDNKSLLLVDVPADQVDNIDGLTGFQFKEGTSANSFVSSETTSHWHLQRLVTRNLPLRTEFDATYSGDGVNVYLMDSGIDADHDEFANATIKNVHTALTGDYQDATGHGTAMASLIVGETVGVARNAHLHNCKILDADGIVDLKDIVEGFNEIEAYRMGRIIHVDNEWDALSTTDNTIRFSNVSLNNEMFRYRSLPQVICTPWYTTKSPVIDYVCEWLRTNKNTVIVAAAGNHGQDINDFSPAGLDTIITVGASDQTDAMTSFTNFPPGSDSTGTGLNPYGEQLDLFAPGVNVTVATHNTTSDFRLSSGTSCSCAIVAGAAAIAIEKNSSNGTPDSEGIKNYLISQSLTGMLFRDESTYSTTPNNIVYLENSYYATVWNTPAGSLGNFLKTDTIGIDLDIGSGVTITSASYASLPSIFTLDSANSRITADSTSMSGISADTLYNFVLIGTDANGVAFPRHFNIGIFVSEVNSSNVINAQEVYTVDNGDGTFSERNFHAFAMSGEQKP